MAESTAPHMLVSFIPSIWTSSARTLLSAGDVPGRVKGATGLNAKTFGGT